MIVDKVQNSPIFKAGHIIKTYWKAGKLPTVKYGIYGGELTQDTLSIEHIQPRSQGGSNENCNVALATKIKNNSRGTKPLSAVLTRELFNIYIDQFRDIKLKFFNGNQYIKELTHTVNKIFAKEGKPFI